MRTINQILKSAIVILLFTIPVAAQTYYISPAGDDAAAGTIDAPWHSIDKACATINAGATVLVRGGSYRDNYCHGQARGTTTSHITIKAYPNEMPIFTGTHVYGVTFNIFGAYWDLEGLRFEDTALSAVVNINAATDIRIKSLAFKNNNGAELIKASRAQRVTITNSSFDTTGITTDAGQGDCIAIRGSSEVLVEGNSFTRCGHSAVDVMNDNELMSTKVVVRNNIINQHWGGGTYMIRGTHDTLVEGNVISYVGEEVNYPKACLQAAGENGIWRHNICQRTGLNQAGINVSAYTLFGIQQNARNNRFYNEDVYRVSYVPFQMVQKDDARIDGNKIVNSILYFNKTQGPQEPYWTAGNNYIIADTYQSSEPWDVMNKTKFIGNLILHADATGDKPDNPRMVYHQTRQVADLVYSLAQAQETFGWSANREVNPKFVDAVNSNFALLPDSPAIDSGVALTTVTSTGGGNRIPVDDPYFFSNGLGVIDGDVIRVGANTVRVTEVDLAAKTLTVDKSISFTAGDPVNLNFNGAGPDIGAIESSGVQASPTPTPTPSPTPTPTSSPLPTPIPSPSPTPSPTPTPIPTPLPCSISAPVFLAMPRNSQGFISVALSNLTQPITVKVIGSDGQVWVDPLVLTVDKTSTIAAFRVWVKKQNRTIQFQSQCGTATTSVVIR